LNYGRANQKMSNSSSTVFGSDKPEYALPGARYKRWLSATVGPGKVRKTYVFRGATKVNHWISIL
jgi:hypothetical protein